MRKVLLICSAVVLLGSQPAQAHIQKYRIFEMSGALENPANGSAGTGYGLVTFDLDLFTMRLQASFEGLTGNTSAAHIHCCATYPTNAGVATQQPSFTGFPLGVKSGTYDHTFDMTLASSWNPTFVTAQGGISNAMTALLTAADAGNRTYLNLHTQPTAPGGEIRGYLVRVPEPSSFMLALLGLAGVVARRRHR